VKKHDVKMHDKTAVRENASSDKLQASHFVPGAPFAAVVHEDKVKQRGAAWRIR